MLSGKYSDEEVKGEKFDLAIYELAFASIHETPVRAFDRKQRASIFNRVFDTLLNDWTLSPQVLTDHLKLLISCLAFPNSSMNLLRDRSGLQDNSMAAKEQKVEPALLRIAKSMSGRFDSPCPNLEVVGLLRTLVCKVLG